MDEVDWENEKKARHLAAAEEAASAGADVAKELRLLRVMLKRELGQIREDVEVIAARVTDLPELLEEHTREVGRVADQLEKMRLAPREAR